jgi:hypothetical protein
MMNKPMNNKTPITQPVFERVLLYSPMGMASCLAMTGGFEATKPTTPANPILNPTNHGSFFTFVLS